MDSNTVGADRLPDGSYYDLDPYVDTPWHDDYVHQCHVDYDERGTRTWRADRTPAEIMYAGGLPDAAAALNVEWAATVGHWGTGDPFGIRRIDTIRVTRDVVPALRSVEVERTEVTLSSSDHLPVVATYETTEMG